MLHLRYDDWRAAESAHEDRVDSLTRGHLARKTAGQTHPVEDFLFSYYRHSPGQLRRWHPGLDVVLTEASDRPRAQWRHYTCDADGSVRFDRASFVQARGRTLDFVRALLSVTAGRPPTLACFGMHEWAMVHRLPAEQIRHQGWPLRLGSEGTDAVVEAAAIRCSHFDAFRFFTPSARPLNELSPTRESQVENEQPGCLHAGMDLYKWCFKLAPAIPSDLTLDAFELAREIRLLDMQASPYDLRTLAVEPVPIETQEGKATYVARQRAFALRGNEIRRRMLAVIESLTLGGAAGASALTPHVQGCDDEHSD